MTRLLKKDARIYRENHVHQKTGRLKREQKQIGIILWTTQLVDVCLRKNKLLKCEITL